MKIPVEENVWNTGNYEYLLSSIGRRGYLVSTLKSLGKEGQVWEG